MKHHSDNGLAAADKLKPQKGFTLIELSIVLVIIGLIVGGILVGQDLIKAAEVRATIGQIEKYNSAVNTFRSKYNGMPGDLTSEGAAAFGFTTRAGTIGEGDGNGLIQGNNGGAAVNQTFTQEAGMLWNDLSVSNLMDGNYTQNNANKDSASIVAVTAANISAVFPPARLGRGNYVTAGASSSINYWYIAGIGAVAATTGVYSMTANLTPIESYNMDIKLDDGLPLTGVVQARGTTTSTTAPLTDPTSWSTATVASAVAGDCVTTGASGSDPIDTYNRGTTTGGAAPACMLRFRFN